MQQLIGTRERAELIAKLHAAAVPAGAVNNMADVFELPHAQPLVVRDGEGAPPIGLRQVAFQMDHAPPVEMSPPPRYGEHTRMVLCEHLGMREDELQQMVDANEAFCSVPGQ